jgi:hypothetical protein
MNLEHGLGGLASSAKDLLHGTAKGAVPLTVRVRAITITTSAPRSLRAAIAVCGTSTRWSTDVFDVPAGTTTMPCPLEHQVHASPTDTICVSAAAAQGCPRTRARRDT